MIRMIGSDHFLTRGTWLPELAVNQDMWTALIPAFSQGAMEIVPSSRFLNTHHDKLFGSVYADGQGHLNVCCA